MRPSELSKITEFRPFLCANCVQNVCKIPRRPLNYHRCGSKSSPVTPLTSCHCSTPQRPCRYSHAIVSGTPVSRKSAADCPEGRQCRSLNFWKGRGCRILVPLPPVRDRDQHPPARFGEGTGISILIPSAVGTHRLMVVRSSPPPPSHLMPDAEHALTPSASLRNDGGKRR